MQSLRVSLKQKSAAEDIFQVGRALAFAAQDPYRHPWIVDVAFGRYQITMPGIAFRRGKAALGAHRRDIEEFRDLDALDQRALLRQSLERPRERGRHRIVEIVERDRGGYRQPHALDGTRLQRPDRLIR